VGRERKELEDLMKNAEKQWNETQDAVSGRDLNVLNTNIANL
jgi:hypothetical protein